MRLQIGAAVALAFLKSGAAAAETHLVTAKGVAWRPPELKVSRGDVVEWKNVDIVPHNVVDERHRFASRNLEPGKSYKWKATRKGTFKYRCTLHPEMVGTVIVE